MLHIETRGTWREMGRQIGEQFRRWFPPVLEHFAPYLRSDFESVRPAVRRIGRMLEKNAPDLLEETRGVAEGAGFEPEVMLGLRFFNEIRGFGADGCSGVFVADAPEGPLLARTCDIEPDISFEIQLCRVSRPNEGPGTVTVTYLPLTGGMGVNEHGLAVTGSSAPIRPRKTTVGLPVALINHRLLGRCRNVPEARRLLSSVKARCKPVLELVADAAGKSMLVEMAAGRPIVILPRDKQQTWQACSNICFSGRLPCQGQPHYLYNAYARYGRIVHHLQEGLVERSVAGMKRLLKDVAQPGPICPKGASPLETAYAFVVETHARAMHLCAGNPNEGTYRRISL